MRWVGLVVLTLTGCFSKPPAPESEDGGVSQGGQYIRAITILTPPPTDLASFPLSVLLTNDEALRAHPPAVENIAFFDDMGAALPFEIASYVPDLGLLDAWVLLPTLPAGSMTRLTLRYGAGVTGQPQRALVWPTTDWRGVWHLAETLEGQADDATSNMLDVTAKDSTVPVPTQMGLVGFGLEFRDDPNQDQLCHLAGAPGLEVGLESFTVEAWVFPKRLRGEFDMPLYKGGSSATYAGYDMELGLSQWNASMTDPTAANPTLIEYAADGASYVNTWTHLALVADRTSGRASTYVNGALQTSVTLPPGSLSGDQPLCFGNKPYSMVGTLDEVRLHKLARSPAWLRSSYLNLGRRAEFMTIGPEVSR